MKYEITFAGTFCAGIVRGGIPMQPWAEVLYKSHAWRSCRDAYAKSVGGLCELCMTHGIHTAGEIVHHKVHLTPENINDPSITLSWDNLQLVCRNCHSTLHGGRRCNVDLDGKVTARW